MLTWVELANVQYDYALVNHMDTLTVKRSLCLQRVHLHSLRVTL